MSDLKQVITPIDGGQITVELVAGDILSNRNEIDGLIGVIVKVDAESKAITLEPFWTNLDTAYLFMAKDRLEVALRELFTGTT